MVARIGAKQPAIWLNGAGKGNKVQDRRLIRWGGAAAILGGVLWILFYTGHTFTHGSTQSPRGATILGFESLDFNRLLTIPALLFIVGLFGARATQPSASRHTGRVAFVVALVGLVMIALGVVLETWIIDPNEDFENPLVQGGWIAFIFGLFPVLPVGMILYGIRAQDLQRRLRFTAGRILGTLALGAAAFAAGVAVRRGGTEPGWRIALLLVGLVGMFLLPLWPLVYAVQWVPEVAGAGLIALFGLGWVVLGWAFWSQRAGVPGPPSRHT